MLGLRCLVPLLGNGDSRIYLIYFVGRLHCVYLICRDYNGLLCCLWNSHHIFLTGLLRKWCLVHPAVSKLLPTKVTSQHLSATAVATKSSSDDWGDWGSFSVWILQKPLQLSRIFGQPFPFLAWHPSKCAGEHKPVTVVGKRTVWYRQWSRKLSITCVSDGFKKPPCYPRSVHSQASQYFSKSRTVYLRYKKLYFSNDNIIQKW